MPEAKINGATIHYETYGGAGPWIALTPGGRAPGSNVAPLAERLSREGYRVLLHDRRNCGRSDVIIEGDASEQEIWADDLYGLLTELDALPVIAGGGSAGCRLSLLLSLRHPGSTRCLLLWAVTGGRTAAERLGHAYYGQFIDAAEAGGMAAVCATEFFAERIRARPENRDRPMAVAPADFIEVMARWREFFLHGADLPVIGATAGELERLRTPACIVPGNDEVHPREVGINLGSLLPESEVHTLRRPTLPPAELMSDIQRQLGDVFAEYLASRRPDDG